MSFYRSTLIGIGLLFALSGCASATLTAGANLAKVGQTAALQMEQNAIVSSDTMASLRKAVAFNDGFNAQIANRESATFLRNEAQIQASVAQYARMLESLSAAYSALGDLASYDAAGTFNTAF